MRAEASLDPSLTPAQRVRLRGLLKIASVAGAFGMFSATVPRDDVPPGSTWRLITSDGIRSTDRGTPERPGPWAFPPAAALVEGAGRLLVTPLMHEVRLRGGAMVQVDTDGGFIVATPSGGQIPLPDGSVVHALSFAEVQEIRDRFAHLARWSGLPIVPDRLDSRGVTSREGIASLVKFADPMVGPGGQVGDFLAYSPGLRRFAIHPAEEEP